MKALTVRLFLAATLALAGTAAAVDDKPYPTPDYDNAPFYYDASKNALVELDATNYVVGARPKFAHAEALLIVAGTTSSVTLASDATFVVKLKPGTDPHTLIDLNRATVNDGKGRRDYVIYKKGIFTAEGVNPIVDINFKKVGEGIYLMTPKSPLLAGEYFFSVLENAKSKVVYCFTVKPTA